MHYASIIVLKGGVGMDRKTEKDKKKRQNKAQNKVSLRAMIEAKVPSACYELSEKPACHSVVKYESG
jgi:hypothetical protein